MRIKNNIRLFGNFKMTVHDHASGKPEKVFSVTKKNQITDQGRQNLLHLFAPDPAVVTADKRLGRLIAGEDGTPPTVNNTRAGFTDVWTSDAFTYGDELTIESAGAEFYINIEITIPEGEAAGYTLREAGIVTADDAVLYARQIHNPIAVSATMSITYNWQLGMSLST